jgi:hypothetical protein
VFIRACFDESIRPDFDEPICVGGYLFKEAACERFKRQWHRTVLRYGERRFNAVHMTDLFVGVKEYKGIETKDRVAILGAAIDAVCRHAYAGMERISTRRSLTGPSLPIVRLDHLRTAKSLKLRSCRTRRNLACTAVVISPTSSRNSTPPAARSIFAST